MLVAAVRLTGFYDYVSSRGREFAEQLLRASGRRMAELLPPDTIVAHLGDQGFAVVFDLSVADHAAAVRFRLHAAPFIVLYTNLYEPGPQADARVLHHPSPHRTGPATGKTGKMPEQPDPATPPTARISTGNPGLDDILGGGLDADRMYLYEGQPGAGKTTLALEFLLEGARRGERVLYITLSETERELRLVARRHGWDLSGVEIVELVPSETMLDQSQEITLLHPAELELGQTTRLILERVENARQVGRIVSLMVAPARADAREADDWDVSVSYAGGLTAGRAS